MLLFCHEGISTDVGWEDLAPSLFSSSSHQRLMKLMSVPKCRLVLGKLFLFQTRPRALGLFHFKLEKDQNAAIAAKMRTQHWERMIDLLLQGPEKNDLALAGLGLSLQRDALYTEAGLKHGWEGSSTSLLLSGYYFRSSYLWLLWQLHELTAGVSDAAQGRGRSVHFEDPPPPHTHTNTPPPPAVSKTGVVHLSSDDRVAS